MSANAASLSASFRPVNTSAAGDEVWRERVANEASALEGLIDRVVNRAGGPGCALWVIESHGGDGAVLIAELLGRHEVVATLTPAEVAARRKDVARCTRAT
jgi:hypothetical protein